MGLLTSLTGGASDAQVATAIAAAQGLGQLSVVQAIDGRLISSAAALSANNAYLAIFRVSRAVTISTLSWYVGTASGNVDAGLYQISGGTWTRLASTGSTAAAGTNAIQSASITPVALTPGVDYAFAFAADNATVTVGRYSGLGALTGFQNLNVTKATSFPLPSSITTPVGSGVIPWVAGT